MPHVGWNAVNPTRPSTILAGVAPGAQAYFTHSYAAPIGDATAATTATGPNTFASVVERGAIFGLQFHPEKSGRRRPRHAPQFLRTGNQPGPQLGAELGAAAQA